MREERLFWIFVKEFYSKNKGKKMKVALSTATVRTYSAIEAIKIAYEYGYDAVEVWIDYLEDIHKLPREIRKLAEKYSMELTLHGPCRDINVASINAGIRRESVEQCLRCVQVATRLGASIVVIHPGNLSSPEDSIELCWKLQIEFFKELAEEATKHKISIAIENMDNSKKQFVTRLADIKRILNEVRIPSVGITFDIAHMLSTGQEFNTDGFERDIIHIHLSDSSLPDKIHMPLGEGGTNLAIIIGKIKTFYDGIVVPEGYSQGRELEVARNNREFLSRLEA